MSPWQYVVIVKNESTMSNTEITEALDANLSSDDAIDCQDGSEISYGDRRDSKEGFAEADSDSGVDGGVSSGCSTVDDCPVVSVNDVVAYYDDVRPRRRHVPPLNFYHLDVERMALDYEQVGDSIIFRQSFGF